MTSYTVDSREAKMSIEKGALLKMCQGKAHLNLQAVAGRDNDDTGAWKRGILTHSDREGGAGKIAEEEHES